jgi:xanthosine utilization system XapX-like protein
MKAYLLSLGAGVLVGVVYSLAGRPIANLSGGQVIPLGKQLLSGTALSEAWRQSDRSRQLFGSLPGLQATETTAA